MKILSVGIPCYNSAEYMDHAIESLLICRDDIEIIIVNDGSKDDTEVIGKQYVEKYPDTVKYVYQENGGHGEAVNTGLKNATGKYFKVLDSDDWFDKSALVKVVETLKELDANGKDVDMFIVNYIYYKPSENKSSVINYKNALPRNKVFEWYEVKHFYPWQNLLMHSVIYRSDVLRECNLILPKHTFYVDNLFVYEPLPYVKTMYYLDVDLYYYFIGRVDQSVNEEIMISRIDQQIAVNKRMMETDVLSLKSRKLRNYMVKYLSMLTTVSSALLVKSGTEENLAKRDELWAILKEQPELYKAVKHTVLGFFMEMKSKPGRFIISHGYDIAQKIFNFN